MHCLRELRYWQTLIWWLAVLSVVVVIKHHYSVATAADLDWMLRPLSLMLEWISGHHFHRDSFHEWVSTSADVRLVKACAGINFLLMSALAWAWTFRPDRSEHGELPAWLAGSLLLLCAVPIAAWSTALLANSLRILVAMNLSSQGAEVHRLIGMLIYVPLLSLQLHLGDRRNWRATLIGPVLLYFMLMALVPLLTGNALRDSALFIQHLLYLTAMAAAMAGVYVVCLRYKRSTARSNHSGHYCDRRRHPPGR